MTPNLTNLNILADFLLKLPPDYQHFDMEYYAYDDNHDEDIRPTQVLPLLNKCGTTACAAGHGPAAGLAPEPGEKWRQYIGRVFGIEECGPDWDEIFSPALGGNHINAAIRIKAFINARSR